jgi:HK97 family phage major capsid protein
MSTATQIDPKVVDALAKKVVVEATGKNTPAPGKTIVKHVAGGSNGISKPYSLSKLGRAMLTNINSVAPSTGKANYEFDVNEKLKSMFGGDNNPIGSNPQACVIPTDTRAIIAMCESSEQERMAVELHERVKGFDFKQIDQDAIQQVREKSMNLSNDQDGGIFRGPAQLGDLIDLMRNEMVLDRAGAKDITLPANGLMKLPKKVNSTQSYHEGEGYTLTPESQQKFGLLELNLKKIFCISTMTNEMSRFNTVDGEAMLREDMAQSTARKMDKTMLQGLSPTVMSGGAKAPRGLISYGRPGTPLTQWSEFEDYLIEYTAGVTAANGDTLQPDDLYKMLSKLPDEVQGSDRLKFVGRYDLHAAIANRRADAVVSNDGKGMFLFDVVRGVDDKAKLSLAGRPYIGSSQVSNQRVKGAGNNLTYLLAGDFSNWVIARLPVAEFLPNALADSNYRTDTTSLRMINFYDAGPRHAAAFVFVDNLLIV